MTDELKDIVGMLGGICQDMFNYESRKVGRDDVNGLSVSTCFTSDCGYETAILDVQGAHPVERYGTREQARAGHAKWLEVAAGELTEVTDVGYGNSVEPRKITLVKKEVVSGQKGSDSKDRTSQSEGGS